VVAWASETTLDSTRSALVQSVIRMHPYATDLDKRGYVPLAIAVVSIVAAWSLSTFLGALRLSVPWWVDAPSVLGFYGLLSTAFDKRIWRMSAIRRLLGIPNLNGTHPSTGIVPSMLPL